jgi:hypothetical protein
MLIARIRQTTVVRNVDLREATELYEDLNIWGDDFYDLIDWIAEVFRTDFSAMDFSKLVPGEGAGELGLARLIAGRSPYESCTIGRLLAAIERGHW